MSDQLIDTPENRERVIQEARARYTGGRHEDDIEIDDEPVISIGEGGCWVAAWVWVPLDSAPDPTGEDEWAAQQRDGLEDEYTRHRHGCTGCADKQALIDGMSRQLTQARADATSENREANPMRQRAVKAEDALRLDVDRWRDCKKEPMPSDYLKPFRIYTNACGELPATWHSDNVLWVGSLTGCFKMDVRQVTHWRPAAKGPGTP